MEIQWLTNSFKGVVTLYETNITLNTVAASNFENAYATMIGYSKKDNCLVIKYLNKEVTRTGLFTYDGTDVQIIWDTSANIQEDRDFVSGGQPIS